MMQYIELRFDTNNANTQEILLGQLDEEGTFTGFEQTDNQLIAYLSNEDYSSTLATKVDALAKKHQCHLAISKLEEKNWNADWEADYQPVLVDDFCAIRATFHKPFTQYPHEVVITPKMSFGTGHHATTYMMVQQMKNLDFVGKKVFDYGCGTAILAILAEKLGASPIYGIDIEKWAYENALENLELNNCKHIRVDCSDLEKAKTEPPYDIVLANINRNVILHSLPLLGKYMRQGGYLLASGFLEQDADLVHEEAAKYNFRIVNQLQRDRWCCTTFVYNS